MSKCKQGYYYCYTDKKCKPISKGLRVTSRYFGSEKEPEEVGIDVPTNGNGESTDGGGSMGEGTLHKWFKGSKSKRKKGKKSTPGWVNVLTGGTCASDEPGEGVPKCVSRDKYDSMTPAERRSAARRKKQADPGQQKKTGAAKPTYVSTDKPKKKMKKEEVERFEEKFSTQYKDKTKLGQSSQRKSLGRGSSIKDGSKPTGYESPKEFQDASRALRKHRERFGDLAKEEMQVTEAKDKKGKGSGTKDACYRKVKSRYSVWPSAYASGALVKCRKVGAANWGNKSEEMDYASFVNRAKKTLEKNKEKTLKGETKTKKEEWIVDNAAQYFFNEGINEEGLVIFIEELGVENFVEFVHDLAEDSELIEAYALTGKKKTTKRLPKGTQPAKTTKATIARGDRTIKAASPSGAFKKRPAAAKAVETAKEKQPEKKPVKSTLAKSVADTLARGALSAWQGHKAAMKKKKEGGSVASQIGAGLGAATGAMLKKGKKHLSDDYDYSNWRDEFKAMEYEFINLIEPEPLVTEASFEINPQKHREEVKAKKIRNRTKTGDEGSEIAKKKVKGPKLMGEDKYSDLSKNAARMSLLNNPGPRSTPEQTAEKKARLEKKRGMKLDDHPQFKKEEVDKRRAPKELLDRLNSRMVGWMADDGPNKPAYDAKQRLLKKAHEKRKKMKEEVETIDESGKKCWKGYKKAGTQKLFGKTYNRCVKENEQIDEIAPVVAGAARVLGGQLLRKGATRAIAGGVAKGAAQGLVGGTIGAAGRIAGGGLNAIGGIGNAVGGVGNAVGGLSRKAAADQEKKNLETRKQLQATEEFVDEAKDETEIGITGLPIPKKKRSPKKQYEFEKKRRENLGRNVGGKTYSADVAPYKTNPRVGYLRNEYEMENELGEARHTPTKPDLEANIGGGNLQKLSKKASKRIDYDVDGDVDPNDKVEKKTGDYGEELPTPFGKFRTGDSKKVKVKKEEVSNWKDEIDEGWKSALAGAGLATAVALHGGGSKTDKKPQPKSQSSSVEKVSTQQKEKSAMDKWRKANPELAKRADNPKPFKRKKLSPINPEWAKANPELAKKERARRAQRGSN